MTIHLPGAVRVRVEVDKRLAKITKLSSFESVVSDGIVFVEFLYFLFQSYPEIEKKYPPGTLAMSVNGMRPSDFTTLQEGDVIKLWIPKEKIQ